MNRVLTCWPVPLILGLAFLLGACTLQPAVAQPGPTADAGALSTRVAATVAAEYAQQTLEAQALPSATPEPPTAEPPTPEPATSTPEPTATETPLPTPTFTTGDPRLDLGNPTWADYFNKEGNWTLYSAEHSKTEINGGYFRFTMIKAQAASHWTLSWPEVEDFYLETVARTPEECSGKDRYGLMFRAPDPNHGYLLAFSCDGHYRLAKWDGKIFETLIDWTPSGAILTGPNQTNRIGIRVVGKQIGIYANGILLDTITDSSHSGKAKFGFLAGAEKTNDFTVSFDEIAYWEIK